MGENQERCEFFDKLLLVIVLMCSICILDCNILIKVIVGLGTLITLGIACRYRWTSRKWFLACLVVALVVNVYFDCRIYAPYRYEQSANFNSQRGFATSQVAYTYNSGNSDVLIYLVLRDKTVYLHGNISPYYKLLERFSKDSVNDEAEIDVDFLIDEQEEFLNMGRINPYNAFDCFELDEVPALREARNTNKPRLYISGKEIAEVNELVVAVDSLHNFYVMTVAQWEEIYSEK